MAGYNGWKMSKNAERAYKEGKMPISKWTKTAILKRLKEIGAPEGTINLDMLSKFSTATLREVLLYETGWHHTGKYYQVTPFYDVDPQKLADLDEQTMKDYNEKIKATAREKRKKDVTEKRALCKYLVWSGSRHHRRAAEIERMGTIRGSWFYPDGSTEKKSVNANGFEVVSYA